jgi:hypothetical protein
MCMKVCLCMGVCVSLGDGGNVGSQGRTGGRRWRGVGPAGRPSLFPFGGSVILKI